MTKEKKDTSGDELIEALLEKYGRSREAILGENGLLADLKKRVVEKALAGELTHHLGYRLGEKPEGVENHRNGYSAKTVGGEDGAMEIAVPRDRKGSFEPLLPLPAQQFRGILGHPILQGPRIPRAVAQKLLLRLIATLRIPPSSPCFRRGLFGAVRRDNAEPARPRYAERHRKKRDTLQ